MPTQCVAFNCTNLGVKDCGLHFFTFPKDAKLRKIWINKVKRDNWTWKPASRLCSAHFEPSAYKVNPEFMAKYGYENAKPQLKEDAIPTLFNFSTQSTPRRALPSPSIERGAYRKRRRTELLCELLSPEKPTDQIPATPGYDDLFTTTASQTDIPTPQPEKHVCPKPPPLPQKRTRRLQTMNLTSTKDVQCELISAPPLKLRPQLDTTHGPTSEPQDNIDNTSPGNDDEYDDESDEEAENDEAETDEAEDDQDPDYVTEIEYETVCGSDDSDDEDSVEEVELSADKDILKQLKLLVFESSLVELLSKCRTCQLNCRVVMSRRKGLMIVATATCTAGHTFTWSSQPSSNQLPVGNLLMSAALMFSGSNATKVFTFLDHLNVPHFSLSTFHRIQSSYLVPSVLLTWETVQDMLVQRTKDKLLVLGGDGRCDSPGHSAKYGSYTLMDLDSCKILNVQLVQSNEVKSSVHMELEGLKRGMRSLEEKGCKIDTLVTDRHVQVKKFMKEEKKETKHLFDVWHIAKELWSLPCISMRIPRRRRQLPRRAMSGGP